MDHLAQDDRNEREHVRARLVQELVDLGYEEPDAHFAVSLYLGESLGDVVSDPPLTAEEYRAMGLDRDFLFPSEAAALKAGRSTEVER